MNTKWTDEELEIIEEMACLYTVKQIAYRLKIKKPAFVLGDRVLLSGHHRGTNQRLILGTQLVHTSWFYFVELVSPTLPLNTPHRFCLVREEDLVRVNV